MSEALAVLGLFCVALCAARPLLTRRHLRQYSTRELEAELDRRDITVKVKMKL